MLKFAKSFGASFALVLLGALAYAGVTTLPYPSVNGPFLGDSFNNLYTITQAYVTGSGLGAADLGSISQTSGQANCTQIGVSGQQQSTLHRATTSASTGYVCLPTARAGTIIYIANVTGQTVDLYSNAVSFTPGTADKINGTAGTTAYTALTSSVHYVTCFSPVNGNWYCAAQT